MCFLRQQYRFPPTTTGVFYCFACGERGDKLSYVMKALGCDFKAALRFFGLEPGRPPAPDPVAEKKRRARAGLQVWAKRRGRERREEFYNRSRIELCARHRLEKDIDDPIGWELLRIAYTGLPLGEVERMHDLLIGRDFEQLEAFRSLGGAAV